MALKLRQGQIWKQGDEFIRIVHLKRLKVAYKTLKHIETRDGHHQQTSKKDFCRLIKTASLISPAAPELPTPPA